jgi:hypothetical protein
MRRGAKPVFPGLSVKEGLVLLFFRFKFCDYLRKPFKKRFFIVLSSGCSVARLSRMVWDHEVAGSNPATPTV